MGIIHFLLPTLAIDSIGFFFNIRMILGCFADKKNARIPKYSAVVTMQFVYQVTILTMNTIEVWQGIDEKPENFCNAFKALMIFVNVLQVFNIVAVSVISCSPTAVTNKQFFPFAVVAASTILGFLASGICVWLTCSNFLDFLYRASIAGLLLSVSAAFLLFATSLITPWFSQSSSQDSAQMKMIVTEKKKTTIFCATMILCLGVPLTLFANPNLASNVRLTKFICLLTMNLIVGILMPVTFDVLTNLSYIETQDVTLTVA